MKVKERMNTKTIFLFLVLFTLGSAILVNSFSAKPSFEYNKEQCTRYCHNKGCVHFQNSISNETKGSTIVSLYWANIRWLKNNPLGLSYQQMNLFFYVFVTPLLVIVLLWGLFRKSHG